MRLCSLTGAPKVPTSRWLHNLGARFMAFPSLTGRTGFCELCRTCKPVKLFSLVSHSCQPSFWTASAQNAHLSIEAYLAKMEKVCHEAFADNPVACGTELAPRDACSSLGFYPRLASSRSQAWQLQARTGMTSVDYRAIKPLRMGLRTRPSIRISKI